MKVMIHFSKLSDRPSIVQFLEGFLPRDVGLTIVSYLRENTAYVVVTKLRYNNIFDINFIQHIFTLYLYDRDLRQEQFF